MSATEDDNSAHPLLERLEGLDSAPIWRRFLRGLALPFRAVAFLFRHRQLWPFVIAPAVINFLLFGGAIYLFLSNIGVAAELIWVEPQIAQWYDWFFRILWYVLLAIMALLSVGAAYIFVLLVGGIVASPFNDALSERVEAILVPSGESATRDESLIWGGIRALASSIFILLSYLIVMAPILLLNLVPVFGQIAATVLGTTVSSLFLAMEYTDGPVDRRGHDLRQKFELIEANRTVAFAFGLGASLLLWVPLLNFVTIPVAVTGGTALGIALEEWTD